jgi:predicted HTH transcriptional regulator
MISDILASPEGKQLELKHDLSSPPPILKKLVAFANSADRITMEFAAGDFFLPPFPANA